MRRFKSCKRKISACLVRRIRIRASRFHTVANNRESSSTALLVLICFLYRQNSFWIVSTAREKHYLHKLAEFETEIKSTSASLQNTLQANAALTQEHQTTQQALAALKTRFAIAEQEIESIRRQSLDKMRNWQQSKSEYQATIDRLTRSNGIPDPTIVKSETATSDTTDEIGVSQSQLDGLRAADDAASWRTPEQPLQPVDAGVFSHPSVMANISALAQQLSSMDRPSKLCVCVLVFFLSVSICSSCT